MSKTKQFRPALKSDFRKLGLDIRAVNALAAQGVTSFDDLNQLTLRDLESFPRVGPHTRNLLHDFVKKESMETILVSLPPKFIKAIDQWRRSRRGPIPARPEAIRTLLRIGWMVAKNVQR